jgi:hypothetical protein
MSVSIEAKVVVYEVNGKERSFAIGDKTPPLIVRSHPIRNGAIGFIVLEMNGHSIAVGRLDLDKAISACSGLPTL